MSFRKLQGVSLSEEEQGMIRYTCLNVDKQTERTRKKIKRLCDEVGGVYSAALWDVMCTKKSITYIAQKYFVSESELYRRRKNFYESWGTK